MLHYSKKSLFWSLIILVIWVPQRCGDKKIGFNICEFIQFSNIANLHAFHVWGKCILSCNDTTFILHFYSFFCFCNATFFHSSYVIEPPQPSSAIYTTELCLLQATYYCFFTPHLCIVVLRAWSCSWWITQSARNDTREVATLPSLWPPTSWRQSRHCLT